MRQWWINSLLVMLVLAIVTAACGGGATPTTTATTPTPTIASATSTIAPDRCMEATNEANEIFGLLLDRVDADPALFLADTQASEDVLGEIGGLIAKKCEHSQVGASVSDFLVYAAGQARARPSLTVTYVETFIESICADPPVELTTRGRAVCVGRATSAVTTTGPTTTVLEARVRSFTDQQIEMFYLFVGGGSIPKDPEGALLGLGRTACSTMDTFTSLEEYGAFLEKLSMAEDHQLVEMVTLAAGAALCPEHALSLNAALQAANG